MNIWTYALSHSAELGNAIVDHLVLVGIALGVAMLVSLPLGVWTSRSRFATLTLMNLINGMRVVPSLAILFLVVPYFGLNVTSAAVALTVLAMPPVLINTDAAFRNLDPAILEAARGMGMTPRQVLFRVEVPIALPVIITGIRTAAVEVIASATLAAFVGSGGLGIYITRGFAMYDYAILMVGAIPVALLALFAESLLNLAQRAAQPPA
ncbi:MAG: ABC transporter permease [Anaerolineaceae bacterium]|nr:ABC transporter permease [Anaerolineaceae bacterium]